MRNRTFGIVLVLAAIASGTAAAKQQTRDSAPPAQPAGRIKGTVIDAETNRPVRFAKVVLASSTGLADMLSADDGAFDFQRLRPGAYRIRVEKTGYLKTSYGQARPGTNTEGKQIVLADRQQIDGLAIPLSQGGSISGVVRDDHGDPMFRARVRVSRWVMRNGVRTLEEVQVRDTDERGRYRISLLPPRNYVVSAQPDEDAIPDTDVPQSPSTPAFTPVFYPGSLSARSATIISIGPGEERGDIDLQLPLVATGRVSGVVIGSDGRPVPNLPVRITGREHDDLEQGAETDGAGRFVFERVVPGAYTLEAGMNSYGRVTLKTKMVSAKGNQLAIVFDRGAEFYELRARAEAGADFRARAASAGTASGDVNVASNMTTDTTLTLEAPRTVSGRVVIEGTSTAPALRGKAVLLSAVTQVRRDYDATIDADGAFKVEGVAPGRYTLHFADEPPWSLASAMTGGVDTLDFQLEVPRDRDIKDLVLTLRDKSARISGVVTDSTSKPASDHTVIVFASDERLWGAGERRIRAAELGADGTYSVDDLRPGSYLVALTDSVEPDEWLDPDFLRKLAGSSVPVTIADGEKRVQDLRIR